MNFRIWNNTAYIHTRKKELQSNNIQKLFMKSANLPQGQSLVTNLNVQLLIRDAHDMNLVIDSDWFCPQKSPLKQLKPLVTGWPRSKPRRGISMTGFCQSKP